MQTHPSDDVKRKQQNKKTAVTSKKPKKIQRILQVQLNLANALNDTDSLKEGLVLCLDAALEASGMDCGGIYLFDEATSDLKLLTHKGLSHEFIDHTSAYGPDSENVKLILKGDSFYINYQTAAEPLRDIAHNEKIHAIGVLPIRHKNKVIGCMNVGSHSLNSIPDVSRISLEMIAMQLGTAISKLKSDSALRESEERYRISIEKSVDGIALSEKGRYFFVNSAYLKMFGYERPDEIIGKEITVTVHPDDKERVWHIYNLRLQGKKVPELYEFKGIRKDGDCVHIEITATKVTHNGRSLILAYFRDNSERKKAEQAIKEAHERYAALFDRSFDCVYLHDFEGNYLDANNAVLELTGYSKEDVTALKFLDLMSPDQLAQAAESIETIVRNGSEEQLRSYKIRTKDNDVRDIETRGALIYRNGEPYAVQGIARDVTGQKKMETALKESESKFRSLFENSPLPFALTTLKEGIVTDANNKFCESSGYAKEEVIGRRTTELGFYSEKDRIRVLNLLLESGKIDGLEMDYSVKDGKIRNSFTSVAIIHHHGEPFMLSMYVDVTDIKRMESQLRQSQKMESIGTLAGGIAHDFNNILGIVLGNAEMAKFCLEEKDNVKNNIDQIIDASLRGRQIVRQLLDFSRQTKQTRYALTLSPLIKESLMLLRSLIPANIDIRQNYKDDEFTALVDPTQIHQIIINLCTNASRAMPEKGGVIDVALDTVVTTAQNKDQFKDMEPGRYIRLNISDTGEGIAPENLNRIFEPYFTTRQSGSGTGLGLSVVHGIVKDCKGAILVSSESGKGTTFTILLPVVDADIREDPLSEKVALPVGNEKVLWVDDEENLGRIAGDMLKKLGYHVRYVNSPADALKIIASEPDQFDLVVTDMAMPKMTGLELAGKIVKIKPDMHLILCTGYNENMDEERAKKMGFKAFLIKPVKMEVIAEVVRKVLDG